MKALEHPVRAAKYLTPSLSEALEHMIAQLSTPTEAILR